MSWPSFRTVKSHELAVRRAGGPRGSTPYRRRAHDGSGVIQPRGTPARRKTRRGLDTPLVYPDPRREAFLKPKFSLSSGSWYGGECGRLMGGMAAERRGSTEVRGEKQVEMEEVDGNDEEEIE